MKNLPALLLLIGCYTATFAIESLDTTSVESIGCENVMYQVFGPNSSILKFTDDPSENEIFELNWPSPIGAVGFHPGNQRAYGVYDNGGIINLVAIGNNAAGETSMACDIDENGVVGISDLLQLLIDFNTICPN